MDQDLMTPLQTLYEGYIAKAEQLERDKKPGAGLLGLTPGPKDDPCHKMFIDQLQELMDGMLAQKPASGQMRQVLAYIYRAPLEHETPLAVYWTLQAAHSTTLEMAGRLESGDARALRDEFAKMYRRWERLPVQKKVLEVLEKAGR